MIEMEEKKTVFVEGMTCSHCEQHVEEALKELDGVQSAKANRKKKTAVIKLTGEVSDDSIRNAVKEAGYEVTDIQ